jgi:ribosome-binding factor A
MATKTSSGIAKQLMLNAYKRKLASEMKEKSRKKGLLVKVLSSNSKRSNTLVDILKESSNFSTLNAAKPSDDDFLKKFRTMPKGGPSHKIATSRAHHLSNFLTEYIINAFQSGLFSKPELAKFAKLNETDSNGFSKNKYDFDVSNIELMPDLTSLKIHWLISGVAEIDAEVERFFEAKLKNEIRNKLASERVVNYVPPIVFVRDETNCLLDKLDEYLMRVKLDLAKMEDEHLVKEPVEQNSKGLAKKKAVNNLYGVDFERLLETIKKDASPAKSAGVEEKEKEEKSGGELAMVEQSEKAKFESSLKAYRVNKALKRNRLSKSALLKISQLEFEELKRKSFRDEDEQGFDFEK